MSNITFRLNSGKRIKDHSKPTSIYFRYKLGRSIDFEASIKIKILIEDWDQDRQKVRDRLHIINRKEINNILSGLRDHFENVEIEAKRKKIILSYDSIREVYNDFITPPKKTKEMTLFSFIDDHIEKCKSRPNKSTGRPISKGTIKTYLTWQNLLQKFNKEQYPLTFDKINLEFYYDFIKWCENQSLSKNYIGKQIKTLKTFMNEALEQGITTNDSFRSNRFSVLNEEADDIYLTQPELHNMWELDLSHDSKLEIARDVFLIGAYTGLRVSDYTSINDQSISVVKNVEMLKIKTNKTGKVVAIPMHPIVKSILNKYNNIAPSMREQEINREIKEVGKLAKINSIEKKTITKGGKQVTTTHSRCELIKTHTGRRSFCTNAYLDGMDSLDIMAISGHITEKNFLKYIKVTAEERAIRLSEHSFFQESSSLKIA